MIEAPADPVEVTRLKGQIKTLQGERGTLLDRLRCAEDLRGGGISHQPGRA